MEYEKKYGLENYVYNNKFLKLKTLNITKQRNAQFPIFQFKITDENEKNRMNNFLMKYLRQ